MVKEIEHYQSKNLKTIEITHGSDLVMTGNQFESLNSL